MKKIIGVLGGIGPEATGEFYLKLISKFQEKNLIKSNKDYPQIIINSIPAPELIYENFSDKDLEPYIKGLKELEKFGADFIVMVCNTIHLFHSRLQKEVRVPIMDLRKELKQFLASKKIKSIAVLSTPLTAKKELYKFDGIKYFDLTAEELKSLTECIFNFNKGIERNKQIKFVKGMAEKYLGKGADAILLGCTELELMLKYMDIPKITTMGVLAEAAVRESLTA